MEGTTITNVYVRGVRIVPLSEDEITLATYFTTLPCVTDEIRQGVPYFAGKQRLVLDGVGMIAATREENEIDELGQLPTIEDYILKEKELKEKEEEKQKKS